jgi:DNA-binding phage protein
MFDIQHQVGHEAAGVNCMAKAQGFKVSDYLDDGRRVIAAYLADAFRSGDVRLIAKAIGALVRALIAQIKSRA